MTQEDKELLLRDLSARLSYNLVVQIEGCGIWNLRGIDHDDSAELRDRVIVWYGKSYPSSKNSSPIINCKPFLFPLSSMTEGQKRNLMSLFNCHVEITQYEIKFADYQDSNMDNWNKVFNWCYKNHFDYRGLIPMGLAIDATGLNIY